MPSHMVVFKHVGLIHISRGISPSTQESKASPRTVLGLRARAAGAQNPRSGMRLQVLRDRGVLGTWAGCLPGHHSCFPMRSPVAPVRSPGEFTCTVSGPVWWAIHIGVLAKLLSKRSFLPHLPPHLRQLDSQEFSLTRLVDLHLSTRTTLHCAHHHEQLCCHP